MIVRHHDNSGHTFYWGLQPIRVSWHSTAIPFVAPTALSGTEFPAVNSYLGPFETASKKYVPLFDDSGSRIVMMSTSLASPGDSDWGMEGSSISITSGQSLYADVDGTNIHVIHQESSGLVEYHVFSTSSDTWTTKNEEVASTSDTIFDNAPGEFGCAMGVRSTGVPVVMFLYGDSTGPQDEVGWVARTGGTWGTPAVAFGETRIGGVSCVGVDASDRVYFTVTERGGSDVDVQTVLSGDTLGTVVTVDAFADTATSMTVPGMVTDDAEDRPCVVYIDGSNQLSIRMLVPADTPSSGTNHTNISDNTVYGNGRTSAPYTAACSTVSGGTVHFVYADATTQDIFKDEGTRPVGFGTDTEIEDAVTCNRISCRKGNGAEILYVFENTSTVTFGKYSISAGATTPGRLALMGVGS